MAPEGPSLRMLDKRGKDVVILDVTQSGPALFLLDPNGKNTVGLAVIKGGITFYPLGLCDGSLPGLNQTSLVRWEGLPDPAE